MTFINYVISYLAISSEFIYILSIYQSISIYNFVQIKNYIFEGVLYISYYNSTILYMYNFHVQFFTLNLTHLFF